MSEKLDDMVGGVGDVKDTGEASAEEDVEDETRVKEARDALRRRPASNRQSRKSEGIGLLTYTFEIGVQSALRDQPMTGRIVAEESKQKFCQFPRCIATIVFQRTTLAEITLLCWWLQIEKPG